MSQTRFGFIFRTKISYQSPDLIALEILVQMISLEIFYHFVYKLGIAYNASATYLTYLDDGIVLVDIISSLRQKLDIAKQVKAAIDSIQIDSTSIDKAKQMLIGHYTINLEDVREETAFVSRKTFETNKIVDPIGWVISLNQVPEKQISNLKKEIFEQKPTLVCFSTQ